MAGECLDWLIFVDVLFLLLVFLFHVKMMWDQELLGRVQFWWCSMHLMFQTRFGFQVSILVFFFVGAKTSSQADLPHTTMPSTLARRTCATAASPKTCIITPWPTVLEYLEVPWYQLERHILDLPSTQ